MSMGGRIIVLIVLLSSMLPLALTAAVIRLPPSASYHATWTRGVSKASHQTFTTQVIVTFWRRSRKLEARRRLTMF